MICDTPQRSKSNQPQFTTDEFPSECCIVLFNNILASIDKKWSVSADVQELYHEIEQGGPPDLFKIRIQPLYTLYRAGARIITFIEQWYRRCSPRLVQSNEPFLPSLTDYFSRILYKSQQ